MINKDIGRLEDILDCITKIEKYSCIGKEKFQKDEPIQNLFVHQIQIIGEAARSISDKFKEKNPTIPWPHIVGMRNMIIHQYTDVDLDTVWKVVTRDISELKSKIKKIKTF